MSFWRRAAAKPSAAAASPAGRHFPLSGEGPRLVIFTEHFNATYFISFELPLQHLQQQGRIGFSAYSQAEVEAAGPGGWQDWVTARRPQAVVLTRYGRPDGVDILAFCQGRGIPVVYHIDDDLLELPESLGAEVVKRHAGAETLQARQQMLAGCNLIYASTAVLADVLRQRFPRQRVFHGVYAPYLDVLPDPLPPVRPATMGYMGSRGHQEDLALVVPALVRLMSERPGLRFETFGTIVPPPELAAFGERVRHHAVQKSYREFLRTLAGLRWQIGLAPLVDAPFNRCKAPTKFIEYTSCGIATVASNVIVYASAVPEGGADLVDDDWYEVLAKLLDDPARAQAQWEVARRHCVATYDLQRLAAQVLHVIDLLPQTVSA